MEILSWERLSTHLDKGVPALLPMGGTHHVQIGFDPAVGRLFLRVPIDSGAAVPPSAFAELAMKQTLVDGDPMLEISVDS